MAAFGHAAADYVAALAERVGARRAVLFHHQPDRTDDELDQVADRFATSPVPVTVAAERTTIDV
jgi:phosphoribosyl 1,2-cyclic phosphodiesterase